MFRTQMDRPTHSYFTEPPLLPPIGPESLQMSTAAQQCGSRTTIAFIDRLRHTLATDLGGDDVCLLSTTICKKTCCEILGPSEPIRTLHHAGCNPNRIPLHCRLRNYPSMSPKIHSCEVLTGQKPWEERGGRCLERCKGCAQS